MEKSNENEQDRQFVSELRYGNYYIPKLLRSGQFIVVSVEAHNDIKGPYKGREAGGVGNDHRILDVGDSAGPSRLARWFRLRRQCHLEVN